jgi:predicted nucleotide-binding protein
MPAFGLDEALRVARALADDYAFQPSTVLDVARSMHMQPGTGSFRAILSASAAYGLTEGSAWAEKVTITAVGRRAIRPTSDGDDIAAAREAFLKPRIIRAFLTAYDHGKVPRDEIARNVLAERFDVPMSETGRVFKQIVEGARRLQLLTDIGGVEYVQLDAVGSTARTVPAQSEAARDVPTTNTQALDSTTSGIEGVASPSPAGGVGMANARRMYVTHGSNKAFVELLKDLLKIGELEAVVSEQHETAAVPVPDKVISDMRRCGSAIIHVDAESTFTDTDGTNHVMLNENVLIEIGAAMALYDQRFILLVRDGLSLPSNLQGLYQLRYAGETLDAATALKLLSAITDLKNRPLP